VFEAFGQRSKVGIKCAFNVQSAVECDLLERTQGEDIPVQAGSFDVYIKPYELKTFRLKL
jgi:alpha-mannosidase